MSTAIDPWAEVLLKKATEDEMVLSWEDIPDGPFGFHAQQSVEKLIKALLCQLNIAFDYTHNLPKLANQLVEAGEALPPTPVELEALNKFAVVYRYEDIPCLVIPDKEAAIATVVQIREFVMGRIRELSCGDGPSSV